MRIICSISKVKEINDEGKDANAKNSKIRYHKLFRNKMFPFNDAHARISHAKLHSRSKIVHESYDSVHVTICKKNFTIAYYFETEQNRN